MTTTYKHTLNFLFGGLFCTLLLAGCGGGDRGCFGLCAARDDADNDTTESAPDPVDSTMDLSCYPAAGISARAQEPYGSDSAQQMLRFFDSSAASETENRPVLIWITGDTWASAIGVTDAPSRAQDIAARLGAHYVTVSYRGAGTAPWPAQIQDVKAAVRFLRAQNSAAGYRIDANRFFIGGDQAGAHLAALAATSNGIAEFEPAANADQPDNLDLLITLGGAVDLESLLDDNADLATLCAGQDAPRLDAAAVRQLFGCPEPEVGQSALASCADLNTVIQASPLVYLGSEDPQALIYHGAMDCQVPVAQSQQYNDIYTNNSILSGRHVFTEFADDNATLESLTGQTVVEDLVTFPELDCDDAT